MKKIYPLMALLVAGALSTMILMTPGVWLDIPSLVIVLVFPLLLSLANHSPVEIAGYFKAAFSRTEKDTAVVKKGILFFQGIRRYLYVSTFWGIIGGLISMLNNMEGASPKHFGMGAALCIMTLAYALMLDLLFASPFEKGMKKKLLDLDSE